MKEKTISPKVRDMTSGDPLGHILAFAVPLLIGNIFQQIYSMVDTIVVGYHLGDQAIAAIGASASLYSLIINLAGGLNAGFSIVVTQKFGAQKTRDMKQAIAGMFFLDLVITMLLTAVSLLFMPSLLRFMNTPVSIFAQTNVYISVICGGMAATLAYNMFASILRAMGNSRSPLYFLIISCVLNIILDVLLVMTLDMGIAGAAVATILSQAVSAVLCGIYLFRNYREYLPQREHLRVSEKILRALFTTGIATALVSSVVDLGSVTFNRVNNTLGEVIIAAHTAARRILNIMIQPQITLAMAGSTFIGQNWGGRKPERIRLALRKTALLVTLWSLAATAIVYLFGGALVRFTTGTTNPAIVSDAVLSLRIHFAMFPVLGILFCMRNSLQAMGQKMAPVLSSCIELAMKILSALLLIPSMGFLGTCITEPVTWCLMVAFMLGYYLPREKKLLASLTESEN